MKIGIMQPYFFPYIGYWQLMNAVDKYVIYDDVNFIKGGWINRNRILMNGKVNMINLKMNGASSNKLINEVEVAGDIIYNKKLLKTIESCYKKAPYFIDVYPIIENIINQDDKNVARYLEFSIRQICEYLSIETELVISSSLNKNNDLRGQDKVIEICKVLGANEYYNAIGGQDLYSYDDFEAKGLKLSFFKTGIINYKQFKNEFASNLSIIDVMMFNSVEDIKNKLKIYELL
jgi:hypothetical protein